MIYHVGIQHLNQLSLGTTRICLKFQVNSVRRKTLTTSELNLCTFLVLHSPNMFVKASSGQASKYIKHYKMIVMIRISQNSFIVSLKNFPAGLSGLLSSSWITITQQQHHTLICQSHPTLHPSRDCNQVPDNNASHISWTAAAVN